ncbi:Ribosome biogenesis protein BOP1-like protein [Armadillidium nasatum]|uniref:Ribosome biogenesis protein BOP1-like protein n=1 Tax=Armadillidium nasatum TaxID=96803 RepID=A0A5N5SJH3_9CRUS|nr:Ribosome biogenesis protein BOP1-like protein [Armadillidium nasatum]
MGKMVVFLNPETYLTDKIVVQQTNSIFKSEVEQGDYMAPERITAAVTWRRPTENEWQRGYRVVLDHFKEVREIVWHRQGDYFATLMPEGIHRSVILHQLSKWRSQLILGKLKGRVQRVLFHPKEPLLFVATQASVHIFNLKRQCRIKKVQANCRYISCIAVHPGGEHFVIGGYDRKVNWFEMECTKRPHLMRFHGHAVRSINFHRKYPLFASCSDDKKLQVTHATVYDDLLKDPYIAPVKLLRGHKTFDDYYVLDVAWHPYEPYLFSAGADATIRLWH